MIIIIYHVTTLDREISVLLILCCVVIYSLAQSQQYDQDGIVDIFRQYGDHLYRYLQYTYV